MGHLRETINHHLEKNINQIPEGKKIGNSLYVDHAMYQQELMNLKVQQNSTKQQNQYLQKPT